MNFHRVPVERLEWDEDFSLSDELAFDRSPRTADNKNWYRIEQTAAGRWTGHKIFYTDFPNVPLPAAFTDQLVLWATLMGYIK